MYFYPTQPETSILSSYSFNKQHIPIVFISSPVFGCMAAGFYFYELASPLVPEGSGVFETPTGRINITTLPQTDFVFPSLLLPLQFHHL